MLSRLRNSPGYQRLTANPIGRQPTWPAWLALLAIANGLLLAPAGSMPRLLGAGMLMLMPGLVWVRLWLPQSHGWLSLAVGAGIGCTLSMVAGLLLHDLPGPLPLWAELAALNALTLAPLLLLGVHPSSRPLSTTGETRRPGLRSVDAWLLIILVSAAYLRFASLGYSEFQGDEALAMISGAETLEGHQDALLLRGKGPGEVLLPAMLWRLTGTINEAAARLPLAAAGVLVVLTGYLLGARLFARAGQPSERAGLITASLLALNGFMVGFSRIVQYQVLLVALSGLALLCAWQWRQSRQVRWLALAGAFLGAGALAHYDAILVVPALLYLVWADCRRSLRVIAWSIGATAIVAAGLLAVAGPFYVPYLIDPQAVRTGGYLGDRIGEALIKNNLDSFQQFNVFYTSFYYYALTGLLVLSYLARAWQRAPWVARLPGGRHWAPGAVILAGAGMAMRPQALHFAGVDLAFLPFALILLGAFLSPALSTGERAALVWLAVPFLGYNFGVALPLTHIYTVVPAWTLLAGATLSNVKWQMANGKYQMTSEKPVGHSQRTGICHLPFGIPHFRLDICHLSFVICHLLFVASTGGYLYLAYLRHDVEYGQDWPRSQSGVYWSPYSGMPATGFFGFVHRTGWKAVGGLYASGQLQGDYGSNEEPDVTAWYTRGAPRACNPNPEYTFIAADLVDACPVDLPRIRATYAAIGQVALPNGKGLAIYQALPAGTELPALDREQLELDFDRSATPAAFARSARAGRPADVNLGGLVRLAGYDVDARRAWTGGRLAITLYWQPTARIEADYHVFVHLESASAGGGSPGIWGQADGRPVCWTYPTFDWRPGQLIADHYALAIKPDTPPGEYALVVGMYQPDTGRRLVVLDQAGAPAADFVQLAAIAVK